MSKKNEGFRYLKADEIECRVATVKQPNGTGEGGGCSLLLYKDARVDMRLLDERFGSMGWQRHHRSIDGRLYCTIAVRDENGEWIEKEDVGTESYTEKEKGQASDSFKRAGFCWGIGRELYTAPFIWINLTKKEWRKDARGYQPRIDLDVTEFEVKDGCITKLTICDRSGEVRYRWSLGGKAVQSQPKVEDDADYDLAVQSIKEARSPEELTAIWNDCPAYHQRQDFIDELNKRMDEIKRAA